jgi:hypothetical protein
MNGIILAVSMTSRILHCCLTLNIPRKAAEQLRERAKGRESEGYYF